MRNRHRSTSPRRLIFMFGNACTSVAITHISPTSGWPFLVDHPEVTHQMSADVVDGPIAVIAPSGAGIPPVHERVATDQTLHSERNGNMHDTTAKRRGFTPSKMMVGIVALAIGAAGGASVSAHEPSSSPRQIALASSSMPLEAVPSTVTDVQSASIGSDGLVLEHQDKDKDKKDKKDKKKKDKKKDRGNKNRGGDGGDGGSATSNGGGNASANGGAGGSATSNGDSSGNTNRGGDGGDGGSATSNGGGNASANGGAGGSATSN